jgi:hypothetical protein
MARTILLLSASVTSLPADSDDGRAATRGERAINLSAYFMQWVLLVVKGLGIVNIGRTRKAPRGPSSEMLRAKHGAIEPFPSWVEWYECRYGLGRLVTRRYVQRLTVFCAGAAPIHCNTALAPECRGPLRHLFLHRRIRHREVDHSTPLYR